MVRRWIGGAFILLFLASLLGVLMRFMVFSTSAIVPFKHILHAHSHTALLGFGFLFILGTYRLVVLNHRSDDRQFARLGLLYFWVSVAMAMSFLYQSYGAVSITFSTIVMFLAYFMAYRFLKVYRQSDPNAFHPLIQWSLYWFLISTLGIWVLGPTASILGNTHDLYFLSIQFFLHFQFNGWFTYAALGLILLLYGPPGHRSKMRTLDMLVLNTSLVLTYFHSVTYVDKTFVFFMLTSAGVILQLIAYLRILVPVFRHQKYKRILTTWPGWILGTGILCLTCKALLQAFVSIPALAEISYSVREFIVGYIHLVLLGGATISIGGVLLHQGHIPDNRWSRIGWIGLVITFITTEIILFGHGMTTWQGVGNSLRFVYLIFFASVPFPIFVGFIAYGVWNKSSKTPKNLKELG